MDSKLFCIDGDISYKWDDLLEDVKNSTFYFQCSSFDNLPSFFKNLTVALIQNKPIILIDYDLSDSEMSQLSIGDVQNKVDIKIENVDSIETIIDLVRISTSEITLFTSGTTGQPKSVIHTPKSFLRSVRFSSGSKDSLWGFAYNPTHMAGLQVFFQAFCNRSTIVNLYGMSRDTVYNLIGKYCITHISATPTFYRLLLPKKSQYESVVRVTLGGEKSTLELHNSVQHIFPKAKINNIYASTEAGALFAAKGNVFQIPIEIKEKVLIVEGELLLYKDLIGQGSTFKFENNFYHTGDLVEWVDEDNGLFKFLNRKNELINVGGYKVNPSEVEDLIYKIKGVKNCIVFGKSNSILGNILCCEIELQIPNGISEIEIKRSLSVSLQNYKIPRIIKFVDNIVLTRTGKIQRK